MTFSASKPKARISAKSSTSLGGGSGLPLDTARYPETQAMVDTRPTWKKMSMVLAPSLALAKYCSCLLSWVSLSNFSSSSWV